MGERLNVTEVPGGVLLDVRLTPRASRPGFAGVRDGALELRVAAPPAEGAANEAARRLLAELLDLPRGAVSLRSGARSRRKVFRVDGIGAAAVRGRLGG